jgi:hypothetical protein
MILPVDHELPVIDKKTQYNLLVFLGVLFVACLVIGPGTV